MSELYRFQTARSKDNKEIKIEFASFEKRDVFIGLDLELQKRNL